MAVKSQEITKTYALYNADCMEVLPEIPENSIHYCIYSPPFRGLYNYSSDPRDMSNVDSTEEFFEQYGFLVREKHRALMPGRLTTVHCCDLMKDSKSVEDFPGGIVRLHEESGFELTARTFVWKEPGRVAARNRHLRSIRHFMVCEDTTLTGNVAVDQLLHFRKKGKNEVPVVKPHGFSYPGFEYAGESPLIPSDDKGKGESAREWEELRKKYMSWDGPQINNIFSHRVWQRYASGFWDDIRISHVLPHVEAVEQDDEKHVHPLQLDVIHRCVDLYTNPGETVLTPFLGVGSEAYGAIKLGRKAIGSELKTVYYEQAVKNCADATSKLPEQLGLF